MTHPAGAADPLVRPLATLVVELAWHVDESMDDDGEPRAAMKALERVGFLLGGLAPGERERLAGLVAELAADGGTRARREFVGTFAADFGLTDEDD